MSLAAEKAYAANAYHTIGPAANYQPVYFLMM